MLAVVARSARIVFVLTLVGLFAVPQDMLADEHVVSRTDLQQEAIKAARSRQEMIRNVQGFFRSDTAQKALKSAKIDSQKVQNVVAQMSTEELAELAAKTAAIQRDFSAGALTNQQLTYIIIALATAVLVIIIIKA